MAVQLAVADGARVIGTASAAEQERLRGLGVEPVVYGDGLLERVRSLAPAGITTAIDLIGTDEAVDVSVALVADRGRIATIVSSARSNSNGIRALGGGPGADPGVEIRSAARLELLRRAEEGTLRVFISATYPLSEVAAAHRQLAVGHTHGKIILVP
jgi:NADPH:quinone reductase-like Zn-dependent oxidoreductase